MKGRTVIAMCIAFVFVTAGLITAQDKSVPKSLVKFANETLTGIGQDAQLVAFVSKDNASPVNVEKLRTLDKRWQANDNIDDFVKALMSNPVSARLQKQISAFDHVPVSEIPADAVTGSGSGLDPDISPANAAIQVDRVAAARHLPVSEVQALVAKYTQGRQLGFLGEPTVNVLELNIALDELSAKSGS